MLFVSFIIIYGLVDEWFTHTEEQTYIVASNIFKTKQIKIEDIFVVFVCKHCSHSIVTNT